MRPSGLPATGRELVPVTDGFSPERLAEYAQRWQREPGSRVFLQLAEEHRRGGQFAEAVAVLRQGLERNPRHVSALVLLGRCELERGDAEAAREALEQAVVSDPAQLVANRLLVDAYLSLGEIDKARERIEFYRLFNDRDPEIDELDRRIETAQRQVEASAGTSEPRAARAGGFDARTERDPMPFGPVFDPVAAGARIAAAFSSEQIFPLALAGTALGATAVAEPPAEEASAELQVEAEPAAGEPSAQEPEAPTSRLVFRSTAPRTPPPPEPASVADFEVEEPEPESEPPVADLPPWGSSLPRGAEEIFEAQAEVIAAPFMPRTIGEEVEREMLEEPFDEVLTESSVAVPLPDRVADPEPSAAEPASTSATLAELYLSQGHLDEAEAEYRRVLAGRPNDATALAGLEEISRRRPRQVPPEAPSAAWEAPEEATIAAPPQGLTARKLATLRGYLARVRQGRERARVS